jgi:serine protease Do
MKLPPVHLLVRAAALAFAICQSPNGAYGATADDATKSYHEFFPRGTDNWSYLDTGEDPGEGWTTLEFEAEGWKTGTAPLGYGEEEIETKLSFGDDEEDKQRVAFFRRTFEIDSLGDWPEFALLLRFDDGAAIYINGKEIARRNLGEGDLDATTFAEAKTRSEMNFHYVRIPSTALVEGKNVLAVSVHQADAGSSDTILDAELIADRGANTIDDDAKDVAELKEREERIGAVLSKIEKATVSIARGGSGVIVNEEGLILSAAHVVDVFRKKEVEVFFPDGTVAMADVLGADRARDAGMFKLQKPGPWPHADIRDERLKKGEWVIALGHPQGFDPVRGSPLRLGKVLRTNDSRQPFIMSGCTVTGGDSGGPLFDLDGRIVGIHSFVSTNLLHNFHVPMQAFRRAWERMEAADKWGRLGSMHEFGDERDEGRERAVLGVNPAPDTVDGGGVALKKVEENSGAEKAGLKAGDIIRAVDDVSIRVRDDLTRYLLDKAPGDEVVVKLLREDGEQTLTVVLGSRPLERGEARLGAYRGSMLQDNVLGAFEESVSQASKSTVKISSENKELILGTVVSKNGFVLTKASVVKGESDFTCTFADGDKADAQIVSLNKEYDLALLKMDSKTDLVPVEWSTQDPSKGAFVTSPDLDTTPFRAGIVSATQRKIDRDYGFLGVELDTRSDVITVARVMDRGAAKSAGVLPGDVILSIDGKKPKNWDAFQEILKATEAGDKIVLQLKRGPDELSIRLTLGSRDAGMPTSPNQVGGRFSERRVGFSSVIQHDQTLRPEDCGGPLVDLDGRVVGINIARSSRIRSFALPSSLLQKLIVKNDNGEVSFQVDTSDKPSVTEKSDEPTLTEKIEAAEAEVAKARQTLEAARKKLLELREEEEKRSPPDESGSPEDE